MAILEIMLYKYTTPYTTQPWALTLVSLYQDFIWRSPITWKKKFVLHKILEDEAQYTKLFLISVFTFYL
jgi:hypothetical protein